MKKFTFVLLFLWLFPITTFATDYKELELIPIENLASVETAEYDYQNFTYQNEVEKKPYGIIKYELVVNKSSEEKPLAVDVLLFDKRKENIGFVAYCTTKDLRGDYAQIKVNGTGGASLEVPVDDSYIVKGKTKDDIRYLAVLDGNGNCLVGDYDKYIGLTIEDIRAGKVSPEWNENSIVNIFSFILNVGLYAFIAIMLFMMTLYVLFVAMLNHLNKNIFGKKLSLRYVPILNMFYSMNISFGRIIAGIGMVGIIGSFYLMTKSNFILLYVMLGFCFFSIAINIIKFFTKNYDLLFFDPFIVNDGTNPVYFWKKIKITGQKQAEHILDLNYSEKDLKESIPEEVEASTSIEFAPIENVVESKEDIINRIDEGLQSTEEVEPQTNEVDSKVEEKEEEKPSIEKLDTDVPSELNPVEKMLNETEGKEELTEEEKLAKEKKERESFMDMFQ